MHSMCRSSRKLKRQYKQNVRYIYLCKHAGFYSVSRFKNGLILSSFSSLLRRYNRSWWSRRVKNYWRLFDTFKVAQLWGFMQILLIIYNNGSQRILKELRLRTLTIIPLVRTIKQNICYIIGLILNARHSNFKRFLGKDVTFLQGDWRLKRLS